MHYPHFISSVTCGHAKTTTHGHHLFQTGSLIRTLRQLQNLTHSLLIIVSLIYNAQAS